MGKKVLVFGGSGFVGSHVADLLSLQGYEVCIFDLQPSPWVREDQSFISGDITDGDAVSSAIEGAHYVYNFAALADLNSALSNPIRTITVNILGNANILEACVLHKVKRLIYASTVYVNSRDGGFYRCSKQSAEHYIEEYHKSFGLNYTIVRYGSLYGPRSDKTNGLHRVIEHAIQSGEVAYHGNRESMREYIHVQDAARASLAMLSDEFANQAIVFTGQEPMLVKDVLEIISEILGLGPKSVKFIDEDYKGHYVKTSYAYQPRSGMNYIPHVHVDLGQGILDLIKDLSVK